MKDGNQRKRARVPKKTCDLSAPLVVVGVGVKVTVVTMKTVLLASSVVVWDWEVATIGVVDETVDVVVDVLEVWEVNLGVIERVVVKIWLDLMVVDEGVEEEIEEIEKGTEEEVNGVVVVGSVGRRLVRFGWGNVNVKKRL